MDPIGTPRKNRALNGSTTSLIPDTSNGWHSSLSGSRSSSTARAPPVRTPVREIATVASASSGHLSELWARFQFSQSQHNSQNRLLEEVLHRYSNLVIAHEELQVASLAAAGTNSHNSPLHVNLQIMAAERDSLKKLLLANPYIVVLIDGDGVIFNQDLLRMGETGGRKAARQLKEGVFRMLSGHSYCPEDSQIVVRVYANVQGLASTLVKARILSETSIFEQFVSGFTNGDDMCDFIDVGYGKDKADMKLNANFRQHFHNQQCRQIVFGCSHDNGYARLLENHVHEDQDLNRVTLLGGVPFEKELDVLPFDKKTIPGLFRETKIEVQPPNLVDCLPRGRHDSKNLYKPASAMFTPPPSTITPAPSTPMYSPARLSFNEGSTRANSIASLPVSELPVVAGTSVPGPVPSSAPVPTPAGGAWANVARANAHLPLKDILKPQVEVQQVGPRILVNKHDYRIDPTMEYHHDKVYTLKQAKYCNQHYIGRGCCHFKANNGACPHEHNTKLSEDDKKWLRVVARETVCKKGTFCREFDCIYGHHCPYPKQQEGSMRGIGCINGDKCRFAKEMHGMDVKVARMLTPKDVELEAEG